MGKYTMAQIVTLTGINAHTLRKWESRYDFLVPERTETNIRYYSDSHLKKILKVSVLLRHGYKISRIDKMSDQEINSLITDLAGHDSKADEIDALIVCMIEMNEHGFSRILDALIIKNGLLNTVTEHIYPFLARVGVLWGIDKVMPAQEHFISNLIRQKVFSAIEMLPLPPEGAPKVVLFLPEGENHEIGLLLASFVARKLGWHTYYLGQSVPDDNIYKVAGIARPNLLITMFTTGTPENIIRRLGKIIKGTSLPLAVSAGIDISAQLHKEFAGVKWLRKPEDLITYLQEKAV